MTSNSISLWDESAEECEVSQPFPSGQTVDVVVVGGGFTGLSTALHCAEKGLSVQLLEARQIGYGGSGRNCGLVNAALWLPPAQVRERLGKTYGPRFIEQFGKGPEYVFSLIEKHRINCEATRNGTIHAAHSPAGLEDLRGRMEEWKRLGEPVELLDRATVSEMTGTSRFHGGLLDHRAGTINPMGYCRGLARAASHAGASISTGVTALKVSKNGTHWTVETDQGDVSAKALILGTNAYTDGLWPDLKRTYTMISYFQLATRPLDQRSLSILPGRQGLWDTAPIMFNFRRDSSDRLLVGSMGRFMGTLDKGLSQRWASQRIRKLFPELGPVEFEAAWHGQIAMTPDHLPRILELDTNVYTAIGYNGRGITTGTLFGRALAELLTGMPSTEFPLPISSLSRVATAPLYSSFYQAAFTANQMVRSIL